MKSAIEGNKLHDLIHGLSTSDKAHLKKYSKIFISKGETKHQVYYSIIDKMEHYSPELLKTSLEKHGGYRRFKNTEQELYSQILEDLVILKSKKHSTWQYYIEHMKLGYLFLESRFDECLDHYSTLSKIKDESRNATIDYLYYKYYYHTLAVTHNSRNIEDVAGLKKVESELRQSIDDLKTEFLLEAAVHNFNTIRLSSYNKTRAQFLEDLVPFNEEYVAVLPNELETEKWKMLSVYHFFLCNYYVSTLDIERLGTQSNQFLQKFSLPEIKDRFHHEYVNAVYFRTQYLVLTKDKSVYTVLKELREYIDNGSFFELRAFFNLLYSQLSLFAYNTFNDEHALREVIKKEYGLYKKEAENDKTRIILSTDLLWAFSFFNLKEYKKAQPFLDKIFAAFGGIKEVSNTTLVTARVMDILIHFELKNYENIKYYIDNLENELKRSGQLLAFDKQFFNHLRKLNQQLFSRQPMEKAEFMNFLQNSNNEDRIESYARFLLIERWLEGLK